MSERGKALRGDIEGLRAIAVLMVLLYHVGLPFFNGGFAGVDVFFVISGFLITHQLVKEIKRSGSVSIVNFYARRARRLLPAATVVLVFTAIVGYLLLPASRHLELGWDVGAAALYVVNWALAARSVDYLAEDSAPSLVQHYWSLSVEEQFYVVWPLLMVVGLWLAKRTRLRAMPFLATMLVLTFVGSLGYSIVHTASSPGTAYFITATRVWELAIGALLAFSLPYVARMPRVLAEGLAFVGLVMIGLCIVLISTKTPWPGSAALLPTIGTAAVIAAGSAYPNTAVGSVLGVAPMRFIGGLSYGLYLWHWPLLELLDVRRPHAGFAEKALVGLLAVGLSWLTLKFVENPIRFNSSIATSSRRALIMGAAGMALSVGAASAVYATAPRLTTELPEGSRGGLALVASHDANGVAMIDDPLSAYTMSGKLTPDPAVATKDVPGPQDCQVPEDSTEIAGEDDCIYGATDSDVELALVGDSKMLQWFPAVESIAKAEGWRIKIYTKSACGFGLPKSYPECAEYNQKLSAHLADPAHTPDIVLTSSLIKGAGGSMVKLLKPIRDRGAKIVFLADNPYQKPPAATGTKVSYECALANPDDLAVCSFARADDGSGTKSLRAAHEGMSGTEFISLNDWICPPGVSIPGAVDDQPRCPVAVGGVLLFRQGSHLTSTYVRSLTPILHTELARSGIARTPLDEISWEIPPAS